MEFLSSLDAPAMPQMCPTGVESSMEPGYELRVHFTCFKILATALMILLSLDELFRQSLSKEQVYFPINRFLTCSYPFTSLVSFLLLS